MAQDDRGQILRTNQHYIGRVRLHLERAQAELAVITGQPSQFSTRSTPLAMQRMLDDLIANLTVCRGNIHELTETCRWCGQQIALRPVHVSEIKEAWVHLAGDGGLLYCDYSPASTRAEPLTP